MVTSMSAVVVVSVTSYTDRVIAGRVYNAFYDKEFAFADGLELLKGMDDLFDALAFPGRFEEYRHFPASVVPAECKSGKRKADIIVNENNREDKATFVIHVQFRRNATWQGTIQWVDQNKRQTFRSTLEMLRLLDEALETTGGEPKIQWD